MYINYREILKETQESLNYSFEDHAKLFMNSKEIASLHKKSYENNIRHTNKLKGIIEKNTKAMKELKKWRLEIEEEQRESKIRIDFLIKKSDIYKNFRNLLENKYDLAYDTNHDKIKNNSYSVDIINEHNLNPNNLEASLDKINFARYNEAVGHIDSSIMDLTPEQFDEQQIIGKLQPYLDSIEFISL